MSAAGRISAATYARRIERMWSSGRDRPAVLSQREWAMICEWHARGIPLELVREAIEAASGSGRESKRRSAPPRNLTYIRPVVEEAWRTILDGRTGEAEAPRDRTEAWRRCLEHRGSDSALASLLRELLDQLDAGVPASRVDERMEQELPDRVDPALRWAVDEEIAGRLAGHENRMTEQELARTRRRALVEQLRRTLGLPRLI